MRSRNWQMRKQKRNNFSTIKALQKRIHQRPTPVQTEIVLNLILPISPLKHNLLRHLGQIDLEEVVDHHTTPRHRSLVITTVYPRLHMSSLQICLIGQHHETRSSIKLAHGRQKYWGHSASVQLDRSNSPPHEVLKAGKM